MSDHSDAASGVSGQEAVEQPLAREISRSTRYLSGRAWVALATLLLLFGAASAAVTDAPGPPPLPDTQGVPATLAVAIEALRKGDVDAAIGLARRFVGQSPSSALGREVLGTALLAKKNFAEAETEFNEALRLEPSRASAHMRLGLVALERGDPRKAEDWFRRAISLDPALVEGRHGLAVALLRQGQVERAVAETQAWEQQAGSKNPGARYLLATTYRDVGRITEAERVLDQLLSDSPDFFPALVMQGIVKLELGKVPEAAPLLQRAVDRAPGSPWARLGLAIVQRVRGQLDTSRIELEKLTQEYPRWALAQFQLGETLWIGKDREAALRAFDRAEQVSPNPSVARLRAAQFFMLAGELDQAIARAKGALGSQVGRDAHYLIAQAYLAKGELDPAQRELEAAANESPQDPGPAMRLARLHMARGRPQQALAEFERAARLAPSSVEPLVGRAEAYAALRQPTEADRAAQEVVQRQGETPEAFVFLGIIRERAGQTDEAAKAFEQALQRQPHHLAAARALAALYLRTQRPAEATRLLEETANANPGTALPLLDLGVAYQSVGDPAAAERAYRQGLARDPNNVLILNNLAYLLGEDSSKLDEALGLAERAYKTAPRSPAVADTLGWLLYQKGDLNRSETLLTQAVQQAPTSSELHYHLGMVYLKQGKIAEARRELEQALQAPSFPGVEAARRALDSIPKP
ncbi:MAG TPA: tetratricopeptide repeat protein [Methylomirabilota bacterium]|nr:tetratricopeptide repeat protein [Methylomirabilota bacterium]